MVRSPYLMKDARKLDRIQRAATKMVLDLKHLQYEERLTEMTLPAVKDRRER